jgi:hypothetical protein
MWCSYCLSPFLLHVVSNFDQGFSRVRFGRLAPRKEDYLRTMAELGPEPQRSGDIAHRLGVRSESIAPLHVAPDQRTVFVQSSSAFLTVLIEKERGRLFYTILERNFEKACYDRKLAKDDFPWPKALAAGHVYTRAV